MSTKAATILLAGAGLALATWAWAQQTAPPQPPGPTGQGCMESEMMGNQGTWGRGPGMMGGWSPGWSGQRTFASNGEQIYYTGTSWTTGPIPRIGGPPWVQHMGGGCVACHGDRGVGGVPVMMGTAIPEDIRYETLTSPHHHEEGKTKEEMDHPPYTDSLIKRAITQGVDPGDQPLDWTMPRWQMTDQDQNDLLAYLKTLR